ncbi:hypothetical protein ACA910_002368 [Epithemia clementina (nom. ined.)]
MCVVFRKHDNRIQKKAAGRRFVGNVSTITEVGDRNIRGAEGQVSSSESQKWVKRPMAAEFKLLMLASESYPSSEHRGSATVSMSGMTSWRDLSWVSMVSKVLGSLKKGTRASSLASRAMELAQIIRSATEAGSIVEISMVKVRSGSTSAGVDTVLWRRDNAKRSCG